MPWQEVHGIFLLNKPQGMTSNSALQKVRRIFNAAKAGHTGSLDPMATGMLPCCFGDATKIAGLMLNSDKEYIAECQIGFETNTGDRTGEKTLESDKTILSNDEIQNTLKQLTGQIQQIPPMYSALHHNGRRLYELAREGKTVDRPARTVTIHKIELIASTVKNNVQTLKLKTQVSKGTYIRTLIEDFAKLCGSYAHMTELHRTSLGSLKGTMQTLEQLEAIEDKSAALHSMDIALTEYPKKTLNSQQQQRLTNGLRIESDLKPEIYRLYDNQGLFLGLGEALESSELKVKKLFLKSYTQNSIT